MRGIEIPKQSSRLWEIASVEEHSLATTFVYLF